jgi:hypothetical protein
MFSDRIHPVLERIQELDVDALTPKQAHDLLYQLKKDSRK